ncbi:MAG: hypothetical protein ABI053_03045 [Lacisediminihabitans sp.]
MRAITASRGQHPDTRVLVDAVLEGPFITVYGRIVAGSQTEKQVWIVRVEHGQLQEMWTYADD